MINKNRKNKSTLIALIAAALMLSSVFMAPAVDAATNHYNTWIYVATSAPASGTQVGATMLIVAWTAEMPPDTGEISHVVNSPSGRAGWYGMKVQVWDPDNETQIIEMPYSDSVGANYVQYTPEKLGTYKVQAIFPETDKELKVDLVSGGSTFHAGDHYIYSAAVSPITTFLVVEDAPTKWVESPLPSDYWTRPISGASREWYPLAGNWLGSAADVWPLGSAGGNIETYAYGTAPESSHILWSKPFYIGGIADERFGDSAFATAHYQGVQFSPNVILDGKIHWSPYMTHTGTKGWEVIDLYTGETLYLNRSQNAPSMGSVYQYESPNQHGEFAYLWDTGTGGGFFGGGTPATLPQIVTLSNASQRVSDLSVYKVGNPYVVNRSQTPITSGTVWRMVDAHTLNTVCYIANVSSSGTQVYGKDGSYLYYNAVNLGNSTNPKYYCTVWNSSAGTMVASETGTGYWQWRPAGGDFGAENPYFGTGNFFVSMPMNYDIVHNGNLFYSQNFSIPNISGGSIQAIRQDEIMIVGTAGSNTKNGVTQGWLMGISLEPSNRGSQLWKTTFTPPFVDLDKNITLAAMFTGGFSMTGVYPEDGVFTFGETKQLKTWVFDLGSGQELWSTNETYSADNQYNFYGQDQIVIDGKLILYGGYAGKMTAFDIQTGNVEWVHNWQSIGDESPYGNYPIQISAVSGDKIYTTTWEHSYTIPLYRGPNLTCLNATDGTVIWDILDFGGGVAIADGRLVAGNSMDNQIYCYGMGPSATTVDAPQIIPTLGTGVMITGTVTDQTTTGRRNTNDQVDFTLQGTPAVSDETMSAWMEYLFMQQPYPTDGTGVEVTLATIDPNGNYYDIGTVTTDLNGKYALPFNPEVPGNYQIIATFAGSKSYGSSSDTTYLSVAEAPATASPVPAANLPPTETYFAISTVAIIIAIAIVGALVMMMLRKRP
ncbi:MAG: PQQ-binding-like beta-propeller repeat protein [Candidatus Bathyarchaeota archaeon]|nr:PQQ-binding-like beta-propeller repeat protein [Candidatus Bathyarchaeota archaeon]